MAEQQMITVADLGRVVTGKTPPTAKPHLYGDGYPFITPTDIGTHRYCEPTRQLSEQGRESQRNLLLPPNAVCVTCIASVGKMCMTDRPSFTNQQINSVVVDESRYDPFFVYYLLQTQVEHLKAIAGGAATPIINKTAFSEIKVSVPPLPIQRRIAGILSAYDDLIENSQRRIKILESMARALYREWFVHFRYPGHESVPLVPSPLGDIPQGWEVRKLGELCVVTDYVANGSFASLKENVTYRDKPDYAILIRGTDFNSGWDGRYVYVNETSYRFLRKSELRPMDIIVTNVGNVGTTFFVPDLGKPMTLGPNSVLVRPHFAGNFMFHFLRSDQGQHLIRSITSGVAQPKFNKTDFRSLDVNIPPSHLLQQFEKVVEPIHAISHKLGAICANLRRTRDLLLPRLLSGQIDVAALGHA